MALLGYIFLVSFPDNKNFRSIIPFLSVEERQLICARVNQDRSDADLEEFTVKKWLGGAKDWKIWAYGLCKQINPPPGRGTHNIIPDTKKQTTGRDHC